MKKIIMSVFIAALCGISAKAQVKVGDNPTNVNANAVFEMESTTKGLLLPRMTSTERAAITSPAGLEVYDTTTNTIWYHNGTTWVNTLASTTTASNGLTATSGNITLGGALTAPTTISGVTATNKLAVTATGVDAINLDSNTLSLDATNNRVGIGTAAPGSALDVVGTTTSTGTGGGTSSSFVAKGTNAAAYGFNNTAGLTNEKYWDLYADGANSRFSIRLVNDAQSNNIEAMRINRSGLAVTNVLFPNGNVGIGTAAPTAQLHTTGSVLFAGAGTPGVGKVLTSDASGNATWQTAASAATASNGLTATSGNVTLGGALTAPTTISALTATNKIAFTGTGVDAFNIDSNTLSVDATNNKVGIGTAAPDATLAVRSGAAGTVAWMGVGRTSDELDMGAAGAANDAFTGTAQGDTWMKSTLGNMFVGTASAKDVIFMSSNSQRMRITSTGYIGVGTSTPSAKLHIAGDGAFFGNSGIILESTNTTGPRKFGISSRSDSGSNPRLSVSDETGGVERLVILSGGNVGIGTSTPYAPLGFPNTTGKKISLWETANNNYQYFGLSVDPGQLSYHVDANTSNHVFYSGATTTTQTELMRINGTGNVGIGTSSPHAKLHVYGSANGADTFNAGNFSYLGATGVVTAVGSNNRTDALMFVEGGNFWCDKAIVATASLTFSDARIKNIIGASDNNKDLELLNKIQITDYTMKDKTLYGDRQFKKVIAQEVEKVFPQAISKQKGFIPNIYQFADVTEALGNNTYKVTFKNAVAYNENVTGAVKVYDATKQLEAKLVSKTANSITFTTTENLDTTKMFVYGEEVTDYRSVDYEALSTLNISATQELYKQIQELKAQNEKLTANVAKVEKAQAEYAELAAEVKEMKAALGMTAQK